VKHLAPSIKNVSKLWFLDFPLLFYSASYVSVCLSVTEFNCLNPPEGVAGPVAALLNNGDFSLHFSHQIPYFQVAGDAYADRLRPHRRPF
jgi:hypothetical protein